MHFILCSNVTDIRFCKCSDIIYESRPQPAEIRHPGSVQPSVSIRAAGLLGTYRTLTKSNVLHQSQRLKWFCARWQATPRIVYLCFFCAHVWAQERTQIHYLQGELWEQHCNRSFSGVLLDKQGRLFRSFFTRHFFCLQIPNLTLLISYSYLLYVPLLQDTSITSVYKPVASSA